MPLQNLLNLMGSIPKKSGGSRTVAVATTLYRIIMQVDNDKIMTFEEKEAHALDSARKGADASFASSSRALETELLSLSGKPQCTLLWDMEKFFDNMDI